MRFVLFSLLLAACTPDWGPAEYYGDVRWPDEADEPPPEPDLDGAIESELYPILIHPGDANLDAARELLTIAEEAWALNLAWGATPPPPDNSGPDGRIDIELLLQHDANGSVHPEWSLAEGGCASRVFMLVGDNADSRRVPYTMHHEIRHVFQAAALCDASIWQEADAMFAGLVGRPEYSGGVGMDEFQSHPAWSLFARPEDPRSYQYGAGLFHRYLAERYGDGSPVWFTQEVQAASVEGMVAQVEHLMAAVEAEGDRPEDLLADFALARLRTSDMTGGDIWRTGVYDGNVPTPWWAFEFLRPGTEALNLWPTGTLYRAFDARDGLSATVEGGGVYRNRAFVMTDDMQGSTVIEGSAEGIEIPPMEGQFLGFWIISDVRWGLGEPMEVATLEVSPSAE